MTLASSLKQMHKGLEGIVLPTDVAATELQRDPVSFSALSH